MGAGSEVGGGKESGGGMSTGYDQTAETFWAKVRKVPNKDSCWLWLGCQKDGYGRVTWGGKQYCAHRVAAVLSGIIKDARAAESSPTTIHVLHRCDVRLCCNPNHFFLGTKADNAQDAMKKGRLTWRSGEAHANAKLTVTQARKIRGLYATGRYFQKDLAALFSVGQSTVGRVVRNERWRDA